jgi:hypothetical protein
MAADGRRASTSSRLFASEAARQAAEPPVRDLGRAFEPGGRRANSARVQPQAGRCVNLRAVSSVLPVA